MDQEQLQPKVKMPTSGTSYSRQENGLCSELHNLSLQNSLSSSSTTNRSYNTNAHQAQPVFQQISQQLKAETKLIWINFPRYSIHRCWHIAVLYFSVIWIGKKMIKTEIQMSINKKTSRWATELH